MKNIAQKKYEDFLKENIGKNFKVLVEKIGKDSACGLSENYLEIEIPLYDMSVEKNSILTVRAKSVNKNKIIAELL